MKICHLSDLHLEFQDMPVPKTDCDVVVLSGDIHVGTKGIDWAAQFDAPVIYVMGNHEGYSGIALPELITQLRERSAKYPHVHVLEKNAIEIQDVAFFGCTLWTDYELHGNPDLAMHEARAMMNDFKLIRFNDVLPFTPELAAQLHQESRTWLMQSLSQSNTKKNVVVTHHVPTSLAIQDELKRDRLSASFASNCDELFPYTDVWLYGHNHDCRQFTHDGVLFSTNQRGYAGVALVDGFDPNQLIEV